MYSPKLRSLTWAPIAIVVLSACLDSKIENTPVEGNPRHLMSGGDLCDVSGADFDAVVLHYGLSPIAGARAIMRTTPHDCDAYGDLCDTELTSSEQEDLLCDVWDKLIAEDDPHDINDFIWTEVEQQSIGCTPPAPSVCIAKCGSAGCVGSCKAAEINGQCKNIILCRSSDHPDCDASAGSVQEVLFFEGLGGF